MNSEKNNLGMPLPKGKVRVYKSDTDARRNLLAKTRLTIPRKMKRFGFIPGMRLILSANANKPVSEDQ